MDELPTPAASAASREEAFQWAEAISKAGEQLSGLGYEDEALGCYKIAGDLLARAGEFA